MFLGSYMFYLSYRLRRLVELLVTGSFRFFLSLETGLFKLSSWERGVAMFCFDSLMRSSLDYFLFFLNEVMHYFLPFTSMFPKWSFSPVACDRSETTLICSFLLRLNCSILIDYSITEVSEKLKRWLSLAVLEPTYSMTGFYVKISSESANLNRSEAKG